MNTAEFNISAQAEEERMTGLDIYTILFQIVVFSVTGKSMCSGRVLP